LSNSYYKYSICVDFNFFLSGFIGSALKAGGIMFLLTIDESL